MSVFITVDAIFVNWYATVCECSPRYAYRCLREMYKDQLKLNKIYVVYLTGEMVLASELKCDISTELKYDNEQSME
jgi:hypothetical protein